MDGETQRSILEEIRDLHADMARWREEDEIARRADKERSTDERFAKVEDNQARIVGLLHQLRDSEAERPIDRLRSEKAREQRGLTLRRAIDLGLA